MIGVAYDRENPTPAAVDDTHSSTARECEEQWELLAMEQEDEELYLGQLAGVDKLEDACSLNVVVNTSINSISHLGSKLVNLQELNLNNSIIESLRDLGTGFKHLQVLWVSRCGLAGLDGVGALSCLRELYASFNDISELQALDGCTDLEVLDVEGNSISDMDSIHYLEACPKLQSLNLAGNPVAGDHAYRKQVLHVLSGLHTLDDISTLDQDVRLPSTQSDIQPTDPPSQPACSPHADELAMVCEGIKRARVGVDSHEFMEMEMSVLLTGTLPPDEGRPCTASSTSSMLPTTASTWIRAMRSSQQGLLSALRTSTACSSEASEERTSRGSGADMQHRPSSSSSGRPCSTSSHTFGHSRSFSSRPSTATALARLGTGGSAPPTSNASQGLYWRKHRFGPAERADNTIATDEADEEAASSQLTFGIDGTIGASLARDLRRRKKANAAAPTAVNRASVPSGRTASDAHRTKLVTASYDTTALLEELRQWKIETANRALQPEDQPSATAWEEDVTVDSDITADILRVGHAGDSTAHDMHKLASSKQGLVSLLDQPFAASSKASACTAAAILGKPPMSPPACKVPTYSQKTILAKVVRDISQLSMKQPPSVTQGSARSTANSNSSSRPASSPQKGSALPGPPTATGVTRQSSLAHHQSPSNLPRTPSKSQSRPESAASRASSGGISVAGDDSLSIKSRPSSHEDSMPSVLMQSELQGSGKAPWYYVTSISGEVDMNAVNPRPVARHSQDCMEGES